MLHRQLHLVRVPTVTKATRDGWPLERCLYVLETRHNARLLRTQWFLTHESSNEGGGGRDIPLIWKGGIQSMPL